MKISLIKQFINITTIQNKINKIKQNQIDTKTFLQKMNDYNTSQEYILTKLDELTLLLLKNLQKK